MQPDNQNNQPMNSNPPTSPTPPSAPTPPVSPTSQVSTSPSVPTTSTGSISNSTQPTAQDPTTSSAPNATQSTTTNQFQANSVPKKSHKGLIIGLIIGAICIVIIPVVVFFLFVVLNAIQISSTSSSFMAAMTAGDVDKALSHTDGSPETKRFLQSMTPGMKATSFDKVDSTNKSGKHYFLYTLQGANNKMARTALEKGDKGWKVTELVTGNNVALVGASSDQSNATTSTEPVAQSSGGKCLVQSDFDNWYSNLYHKGGKTATESGLHFEDPNTPYTANVHFEPDSLDTSSDITGAVQGVADLANDPAVKGKLYTVKLSGGVATSQSDKDFAIQRAEVVKSELVAKGVPSDNIVIDSTMSATDYENSPNELSKQASRVVVLRFISTCNTSGQR